MQFLNKLEIVCGGLAIQQSASFTENLNGVTQFSQMTSLQLVIIFGSR
jgi:hypothetical protein